MTGQSGSPVIYQDKCIGVHIKSMIKDTKKVSQGILFDD
jgi:hypothetical protein